MLDSDISPDHQHRTRNISKKEARRQRILAPLLLIFMVTVATAVAAVVFEMNRRSLDLEGALRLGEAKYAEYKRLHSPVSINRNSGEVNPEVVAAVDAWPAHQASIPEVKINGSNAVINGIKKVAWASGDDPSFIPLTFADDVLKAMRVMQADPSHKATYRRLVAIDKTIGPILAERKMPGLLRAICWIESQGAVEYEDLQRERLGLWALTPEVAREHGLDLTERPDPRLDPVMSTLAARSYLMELFYQTGGKSWLLASMAYPKGPGAIRDIRSRKNTWTEEELGLWHWLREDLIPVEERKYLVKVVAAAVLFEEAIAFNIRPEEDHRDWEQY